ncbi:hypothetical protein E4U42_003850 [Claviceps africana]|uniref:Uncharacterized protein n=1 Tax=Claviceps africana TaxID=83212 RepID=A0A8K0J6C3_9HYPO|nr:hypothetical protein E4U42_003850 [Claviceps africana]
MTTRRLVLRAVRAGRVHVEPRAPVHPVVGGIRASSTGSGPATITDASFWKSLIPKPFRRENRPTNERTRPKDWNPATYFIVMFLFIGSMSIQMIALRKQSERYQRQSTVRMEQLREALRRLKNGEDVDVDRLLGGADEVQSDTDWEELLKAMESDPASPSTEREIDAATRPEAQKVAAATEQPIVKDAPVDQEMGTADSTTKSKPANLGSFF